MKKPLFILLCIFFPNILFAQEIFTDKANGQECLFLGGLSLDSKKAKVFENDQIRWKELDSMEQTGTDTTYPVRIINSHALAHEIYFMFSTPNGEISGLIYSTGYTTPEKQQYCESDIPEEGASLFCAYLSYNHVAYQGCATIQEKAALWRRK